MAKKKENVVVEEPRVRMGSDLLDLLIGGLADRKSVV